MAILHHSPESTEYCLERLLLDDKRIRHIQVFGNGRPLCGVILEPVDASQSASEFLVQIQPTIDNANTILPQHSRLVPELVIVASRDKPFATTDKGTIKTKETLDKYTAEIEKCYETLEGGGDGGAWEFEGNVSSEENLRQFLRTAVEGVLSRDVPDAGDLFEYGGGAYEFSLRNMANEFVQAWTHCSPFDFALL